MARHAPQSRESPKGFDRLIVAGLQEATGEIQELLPTQLADRVAAVVPAELFASGAEILEMTLEIGGSRGRRRSDWSTTPICSHAMGTDDDLVERAIKRAIDQGGEVDVVHNAAARRLSETCNGIAGLLRFGQI